MRVTSSQTAYLLVSLFLANLAKNKKVKNPEVAGVNDTFRGNREKRT